MLVCEVADAPDRDPKDDLADSDVPPDATGHDQAIDPTSSQTFADWSLIHFYFSAFSISIQSLTFSFAKKGSTC